MKRLQATVGDQTSEKNNASSATPSGHFASPDDEQQEGSFERFLPGVRHILVPITLAQDSLRTIWCAIRLGQRCGARLTLLHVYQPPLACDNSRGTYRDSELWQDRHETEETLKAQGALVRAAYPNCEWVMRFGDAGKGILDVSLELGVDLIVISSHHHHWHERYRPVNIADYIFRHAPCPILEVNDSGETVPHGLEIASAAPISGGESL